MFTGIIEEMGRVVSLDKEDGNLHIKIQSNLSKDLKIDQSVSHNGACLTVVAFDNTSHTVTAIAETLTKTNLSSLNINDEVNLERCMIMNGRLDGHIVLGHVDTTAVCLSVKEENGSWRYQFEHPERIDFITVEKGSICINGTSLTVVDSEKLKFSVVIIPYTHEHTNLKNIKPGDYVNLEFDILGKYVAKLAQK